LARSQINRPFRVKSSLGDDALLLESFTGFEQMSRPFRFVLRLLSDDPNLDMKGVLNKPMVLSIKLDEDLERHIHGNVSRFKQLEYGDDGMTAYEAEIVPWFWFLTLFNDCRIFQNKNVPDIVQQVFKDRGFSDFKLSLMDTYEPREYCVQYRESDFNFVSRLFEEEGIFYYFEHTNEKHTLVLVDRKESLQDSQFQPKVRFTPSTGGRLDEDTMSTLEMELSLCPGKASLTDYDFEKPSTDLASSLASAEKGEYYDYPGRYKTKDAGDRYSRIRLEEAEVRLLTVRGQSDCKGLECGYKFTLAEHYRDDANQKYTITGIHHGGRNPSYRSDQRGESFSYSNNLECIAADIPFRPARISRRPVVEGSQTAVVVGKSGEEIWTDQYGRVKVQFFWDREGKLDENSSCWIRVAHSWAGKQWGAIYTPRIGQEVIVDFLEGDPDRPIITGRVYNADQMPPYTLPDEQTKSTFKSMSSKGGAGFNEFRFEDKKGSEQVFLHGEKDQDIRIKNDRKEWIGQDRHLIVTRDKVQKIGRDLQSSIVQDHVEKVGRDHHLEVVGKEAIKVTGTHSLKVTGDVIEEFGANHSTQVTQNVYVKGMQVVIEGAVGLTLKVGGNFITIDPSGVAIFGTLVQINSGGAALSGVAGALVSPASPADAAEADKADPGAATKAPAGKQTAPLNMSLVDIPPAASAPPPRINAPTHSPASEENRDKKHWIEIQLVGEDGKPVPGHPYRITLPDGSTVAQGTLDGNGSARVENIDPGNCKVTFPNLDKDAWEPK
jgi:type VI secretion system secreted protein VgrG